MPPLPTLPVLMVVYVGFGLTGMLFFWRSRNAPLKRRLWPLFSVAASALFLGVAWVQMEGNLPWFLVPILVLITVINARSAQFCDRCGRTIHHGQNPFARAKHCPACGHPLALGAASAGAPPR